VTIDPGLPDRVERALLDAGADVLVAAGPANAIYLSGAYNPVRRLIPERPAIVLWPREGTPLLIAAAIEGAFLRERAAISEIRTYAGMIEAAVGALSAALRERGLATARIAADLGHVSAEFYRALQKAVPDAVIVDATPHLARVRAIKSPPEIAALRRAALATDRAEWEALDAFRTGATEADLGVALRRALIGQGAETVAFLILGGGRRGVAAHATPADVTLHPGELLRFDMGGLFHGWASDIAKTVTVGTPTSGQLRIYRLLRQILDQHIARLRPGAAAEALYAAVARDYERAGLTLRGPHVGHGIGLDVHEPPILAPGDRTVIQTDMVLCAELIHVEGEDERYHLEELVHVREDGPEVLSRSRPVSETIPVIG
jgi:Xaa-Pro aminopeptidase